MGAARASVARRLVKVSGVSQALGVALVHTSVEVVSEPFENRGETVWASFEPRRMQTRKEVDNMHAALIRTRAASALIAFLAAIALATSFAPTLGAGQDSRPERTTMPSGICPPNC